MRTTQLTKENWRKVAKYLRPLNLYEKKEVVFIMPNGRFEVSIDTRHDAEILILLEE